MFSFFSLRAGETARVYAMVMPGWETCSLAVGIITVGENSSHLVICSLASPPRLWINSSYNSQRGVSWSRAASSRGRVLLFVSPILSSSPSGRAQCRLRLVVLLVVLFFGLGELLSQASPPCPVPLHLQLSLCCQSNPAVASPTCQGISSLIFQEAWDV